MPVGYLSNPEDVNWGMQEHDELAVEGVSSNSMVDGWYADGYRQSMASPVTAEAALLQALIRGPSFGLELIERVARQTEGKLVLNQGSVYPALRNLEQDGFVDSYEEPGPSARGGRPRRYYRLTATGARAAMEQREVGLAVFGIQVGAFGGTP